ncbi:MAG: hypothetical protein K2W95_15035 [Candidatus Obscuribacterales bacterium]|nr:hypothetical protein [Candidatus Obscuribacterales bacterium]
MDSREAQVQKSSVDEGNRLVHMYDNATDLNAVDRKVHDALLTDAIKDHHSELNLKTVRAAMQSEANRMKNPNVIIKNAEYSTSRNWTLPVVGFEVEGMVIYDIIEASKVIAKDDERRAAEKAAQASDGQRGMPNWNPFDGSFGINTAMDINKNEKRN